MTGVFSLLLALYLGAMAGMAVGLLAVYRRGGEAPPGAVVAYLLLALMGAIIGGTAWVLVRP